MQKYYLRSKCTNNLSIQVILVTQLVVTTIEAAHYRFLYSSFFHMQYNILYKCLKIFLQVQSANHCSSFWKLYEMDSGFVCLELTFL